MEWKQRGKELEKREREKALQHFHKDRSLHVGPPLTILLFLPPQVHRPFSILCPPQEVTAARHGTKQNETKRNEGLGRVMGEWD
mmetsp:Transcript_44450/g.87850  ORF Transcript_44450/g.87850 Transcript_44450/m.87850 type:complete len:84 (-) Transcript_44450:304-555(-)